MSDVHMSCPHSPAQLLETQPAASFMGFSHLTFSSSFPAPSAFPPFLSFPENLPSHDEPKVGQLQCCRFASSDVSGFICSGTHWLLFLVVPGLRRASSNTVRQMSKYFPPLSLLYGPTPTSVPSNWEDEGLADLRLGSFSGRVLSVLKKHSAMCIMLGL